MFGFTQHATGFPKWGHIMKTMQEFLLVKEVARLLKVSPNTVRAWADSGKLPGHRHPINNYRVFKKSDIDRLIMRLELQKSRPNNPR